MEEFLFEVSWEVCNKVGGINTVLRTKAQEAVRNYGDNYILLGPDLKTNPEFEETDEECWSKIREGIAIKEIPCRFGRWKIPGNPKVILVGTGKNSTRTSSSSNSGNITGWTRFREDGTISSRSCSVMRAAR